MLSANKITLQFGKQPLFQNVSIAFTKGNCYGIIGANGAGKSTFLKVLSGELEPNNGEVAKSSGERLAVLKQDHYAYNDFTPIEAVISGFPRLNEIIKMKDELYAKEDFNEEDGLRIAELEGEFDDMDGWNAESNAATLLNNLGVKDEFHYMKMADLENVQKVKVLLAQALFGNPDILLLDEPTNALDIAAIDWLENFLADFENTVIVVSHDRHFLNQVCTHIVDIDYKTMQLYVGNYDFWYEASQLALRQQKDQNRKNEAKAAEMMDFIRRFSANASKSRQATSRKKLLEKISIDDIKPSSRRYPFIEFKKCRDIGNEVLRIEDMTLEQNGNVLLKDYTLTVGQDDKIAYIGTEGNAKTALFDMLMSEQTTGGCFKWGVTMIPAYFPKDNTEFFKDDINLIDWLKPYSPDKSETYIRGFLGRMLFTGEESLKSVTVLSGGERVRLMLSKMMIQGANALIMDEPTNHLDLEAITSLNNALISSNCVILFSSQDHQFIQTVANRVVEIHPDGSYTDAMTTYDEYLATRKSR